MLEANEQDLTEQGLAEERREAMLDVLEERLHQHEKWGEQNHDPAWYLAILMEEVGEFATEAMDMRWREGSGERLRQEAVQVAAVAMAIVECLDRGKWTMPKP